MSPTTMHVSLAPAAKRAPAASVPCAALLDERGARVILGATDDPLGLAQPLVPSATSMFGPRGVCAAPDGSLWVSDTGHHRVLGWHRMPTTDNTPADILLGQPAFDREGRNARGSASRDSMNVPTGITACGVDGAGLAVADAWNHRVLIWHTRPTRSHQPPDAVLGQADFDGGESNRGRDRPTASTLFWPYCVSWDGARLWVADTGNRRVLMWDGLPQRHGAAASLVLGHPGFDQRDENDGSEPTAASMRWPHAISFPPAPPGGGRGAPRLGADMQGGLCIADAGNNRLMLWRHVPTANNQPCDLLVGQSDARHVEHNQASYYPDAACLNMPYGAAVAGELLVVADTANSRLLAWKIDSLSEHSANACALAAQPDWNSKGDNRWQHAARDSVCWPYSVALQGDDLLLVADSGNNRVMLWRLADPHHPNPSPLPPAGEGAITSSLAAVLGGGGRRAPSVAEHLRVRGTVQGVGFRPTVWRIASEMGVVGSVINDAQGVLIVAIGSAELIDALARRVRDEAPPLARIESIERVARPLPDPLPTGFVIGASDGRMLRATNAAASADGALTAVPVDAAVTSVSADAATCPACVAEIFDPFGRRFRYPLSNCTHCGPRLSVVTGVPYDRAQTTMAGYPMCVACRAEYDSPADRRFHAQPIACHLCGPKVTLKRLDGRAFTIDTYTFLDDCDAAGTLLARGHIVAIKGLGGYQLACDATQPEAVARLRALKRRERKPFALMAASVDAARAWCQVSDAEVELLQSPSAPIVLLDRCTSTPANTAKIADAVAPGLTRLGFMLPSTGILHLILRRMKRPIVLTSGNLSDEPQAITLDELTRRFSSDEQSACDPNQQHSGIDFVLDHDRPIARRIDDSVMRLMDGAPRVLRRARGLAPEPIALPEGFESAPKVLAYGGELKNTFCLLHGGHAILSAHIGDLADAATHADYRRSLRDLQSFFGFEPSLHACDAHPDYLSSKRAHDESARAGQQPIVVLHHHAHIAACLVDNGWPLDGGPVVGVALDGLGYGQEGEGQDGALWGGEFAIADYRTFERRGSFKPVALLGGEMAMREPWRNTYAHLMAEMGWPAFAMNYRELALHDFLAAQPRTLLDQMLEKRINSPLASSCGRLFDAVAAAIGLCREQAAYEGQGAVELEARVDHEVLRFEDEQLGYPFGIPRLKGSQLPYIEPLAMWSALLGDLILKTPVPTMAARFHKGLARVIVKMIDKVAESHDSAHDPDQPLRTVALSGGVFQNQVLLERVSELLRADGYTVLTHRRVPCNDGGLSLGQAAVAAARALHALKEKPPCA